MINQNLNKMKQKNNVEDSNIIKTINTHNFNNLTDLTIL